MNLSYSGTSGTIAWLAKLGPLMNSTQSGLPCAGRALGQFDSSMSPSCCCMALTTCFGSSPLNSGEPIINSPIMQSMLQTSSFSKYRGPSKRSSTAAYNNCTRFVTRDIYHLRDAGHRRCDCTRERAAKVCDLQRGATPRVQKSTTLPGFISRSQAAMRSANRCCRSGVHGVRTTCSIVYCCTLCRRWNTERLGLSARLRPPPGEAAMGAPARVACSAGSTCSTIVFARPEKRGREAPARFACSTIVSARPERSAAAAMCSN